MALKISVAGIIIEFIAAYEIRIQDRFLPFITEQENTDITVRIVQTNELPFQNQSPVYFADNYRIFYDKECMIWRCFDNRVRNNFYYAAVSIQQDPSESTIYYKKEEISQLNHLNGIMYHICWETHLLNYNRFIFHAACVDTSFGGILLSGCSGIGKSTQGDLWCRYEGARLVNGDRPIIGKVNHKWMAYGSPYAGSSECYVNDSVPINAIVFLGQGKSCNIRKLSMKESLYKALEQTTVNQWDSKSMARVCDLIIDLLSKIPIYEMICTPDQNAVECLKDVLSEEMRNANE